MSAIDYTVKAGTTSKPLVLTLTETDGSPSDLTDAASIVLRVWYANDDIAEFDLTITGDPADGIVTRVWLAGETDIVGVHRCEIESVDAGGLVTIWPSDGYFHIEFTSAIPRDPRGVIEWSDVVGFVAALADVPELAQSVIIAHVNTVLVASLFGGELSPRLKLARLNLAAHYGTHALPGGGGGTSGPVTMEREGDLMRQYASSIMSGAWDDYQTTSYGRAYTSMLRAVAGGPWVF